MANKKTNKAAQAETTLDPQIVAFIEEDGKTKAELAAKREQDFKEP